MKAWTPHDLRRAATSNLAGLGTSRTVIGAILNHADRSVTAIYDRHSYDDEKRQAPKKWVYALRLLWVCFLFLIENFRRTSKIASWLPETR